jgi:hypothetical protein
MGKLPEEGIKTECFTLMLQRELRGSRSNREGELL